MVQPSGYRVDFQGSNLLDVDHAAYSSRAEYTDEPNFLRAPL
jgi:hypothetical protein